MERKHQRSINPSAESVLGGAFEDVGSTGRNGPAPTSRNQLHEFAMLAASTRRRSFLISSMNALIHAIVMIVFAILIAASFEIISVSGQSWPPETRHNVLSTLAFFLAVFLGAVWFVVIWLDGWFLYKPEQAKSGKKGATRDWFDAITSGLSEEPADVSSGLSRTLKISLRTKVFSGVLFMWGASAFILSGLIVVSNITNLLTDPRFAAHAVEQFTDLMRFFQGVLVGLGSGELGEPEAPGGLTKAFAIIGVFVWPGFCLLFAYHLVRNAVDMRWSLLSSTDVIYRFLKMFFQLRNNKQNYLYKDAVSDARRYLMNSIKEFPEEFIALNGRAFFYSDKVFEEFETGQLNPADDITESG